MRLRFAAILGAFALSSAAYAQRSVLDLTTDRSVIRADGKSTVSVTARVFVGGQAAVDGTIVRFFATDGRLDQDEAITRGGIARVSLVAGNYPSTIKISGTVLGGSNAVPASVIVECVDEQTYRAVQGSSWLTIKSDDLVAYAVNTASSGGRLIGAFSQRNLATISNGSVTITANAVQLNPITGNVVAVGGCRIQTGKTELVVKRVQWNAIRGIIYAELSNGTFASLDTYSLVPTPISSVQVNFQIVDQSKADVTVTAGEVAVELGGDYNLLFKKARLLVDGQTLAVLPLHRMTAYQRTLFRDQLLGVASSGITVDVPYTYQASKGGTGIVHLRRGAQFGSSALARRTGWGVDIEHQYRSGLGNGNVQILNAQDGRRGGRLQHYSRFGTKADASLFLDVPNGKDIYGSVQAGYQLPFARLSVFETASRFVGSSQVQIDQGFTDYRNQFAIESNAFSVDGGAWRATVGAVSTTQKTVTGSTIRTSQAESFGTRLLRAPQKVTPHWTYTQVVSLNTVTVTGIDGGGFSGQSSSSFRTALNAQSNFQATYDYLQQPQLVTLTSVSSPKHRLSVGYDWANAQGASVYVSSTLGLDIAQGSTNATVSFPIRKEWELRISRLDTQLGITKFRDTELGIVKLVDGRAIGAYYSTTAKQIQVDFTGGVRL